MTAHFCEQSAQINGINHNFRHLELGVGAIEIQTCCQPGWSKALPIQVSDLITASSHNKTIEDFRQQYQVSVQYVKVCMVKSYPVIMPERFPIVLMLLMLLKLFMHKPICMIDRFF
jgi:hypothetical protein